VQPDPGELPPDEQRDQPVRALVRDRHHLTRLPPDRPPRDQQQRDDAGHDHHRARGARLRARDVVPNLAHHPILAGTR
jgi:hypothetical protein